MRRSGCISGVARSVAVTLAVSLGCALAAPDARADQTETVEQLAERAYSQQAAGKYAEAIATYLKAYDISHDALTTLNIATIYDRKLKEYALATEYYRRYIIAPDADPDRVRTVTERLGTIKKDEEDERAKIMAASQPQAMQQGGPGGTAQPGSGTAEAEHSNPGPAMRTPGVIVGIVGLAGVGTGLGLGGVAKGKNDSANRECTGLVCPTQAGVNDAQAAGNFATASTVAVVVGGVFLATGVVLLIAAPSSASAASPRTGLVVAPSIDRTGAGFVVGGVF